MTDANGVASFSYKGAQAGQDDLSASATGAGGASIASNAAEVGWSSQLEEVVSTPVHGNFYTADPTVNGFSAQPGQTPAFAQTFPTINFDPRPSCRSRPD